MLLSFKIALRFLTQSKVQTLLIALGIAIGVSVQIFIGSLITGLQTGLIEKTIGSSSHISIIPVDDETTIKNWERTVYEINLLKKDIRNYSVSCDSPGFITYRSETEPILMRGFSIENADKIYKITENIIEGVSPKKNYEVLIGKDLKLLLNIKLGDKVNILTPNKTLSSVKVVGVFDLNITNINETWVISNLETSQRIFDYNNQITSIDMQVFDVFKADEVAMKLSSLVTNPLVFVDNWKNSNSDLLSALNAQTVSTTIIRVFVMISVTFGIASVLAVSVVQKSRQIGILKAIGIKNSNASLVFIFQGFLLGILGGILGMIFSFLLINIFTTFAVDENGAPFVDVAINYSYFIFSGNIAVLSSVIASVIPAVLSSRLDPIEVIRNG